MRSIIRTLKRPTSDFLERSERQISVGQDDIKLSKNGGFGLVWNDGGYTQEYTSKYISYKLGTYLFCGVARKI